MDKLKSVWGKDGGPPGFFVRACVDLEVYCEEAREVHRKSKICGGRRLNKIKVKALNILRAKIRKGNKLYEDLIAHCKVEPEQFPDSDSISINSSICVSSSSESDSDSDSDSTCSSSRSTSSDSKSDSDSDSSSSSSSTSSDSDSDSDSSCNDEGGDSATNNEVAAREKKMLRWLISPERQEKLSNQEGDRRKKHEEKRRSKTAVIHSSRRVFGAHLFSAIDHDDMLASQLGFDVATYRLLRQLERREIAPEDYDLLGRLDEGLKPKTLGREHLQGFATSIYRRPFMRIENTNASELLRFGAASPARCAPNSVDLCSICRVEYEDGDNLRMLPCGHSFHRDCIDRWLMSSATTCPSCKQDLLSDD